MNGSGDECESVRPQYSDPQLGAMAGRVNTLADRAPTPMEEHRHALDHLIDRAISAEDSLGEILNQLRGAIPQSVGPADQAKMPSDGSTISELRQRVDRLHEIIEHINRQASEFREVL